MKICASIVRVLLPLVILPEAIYLKTNFFQFSSSIKAYIKILSMCWRRDIIDTHKSNSSINRFSQVFMFTTIWAAASKLLPMDMKPYLTEKRVIGSFPVSGSNRVWLLFKIHDGPSWCHHRVQLPSSRSTVISVFVGQLKSIKVIFFIYERVSSCISVRSITKAQHSVLKNVSPTSWSRFSSLEYA